VTKQEKVKKIAPWIDPEERIAVDFRDEEGLNAVVTGCNAELVDLSMRDAYDSYETNNFGSAKSHRSVRGRIALHPGSGAAAETSTADADSQ
jgi:hypothetical protein